MSRRSLGFTLVEVLISTVILSIVVTALATVFIAVQQSYESISRTRSAMDGSRIALAYLERQLKLAGYGVDPAIAFDFSAPPAGAGAAKNNDPVAGLTNPAIVTDDLLFRYRDPNWSRRAGVSGGSITLPSGTFGVSLRQGRRLLVYCTGGGGYAVYEVSGSNLLSTQSSHAVTLVTTAPFPSTAPSCVSQTGIAAPFTFILQERRVRIRNIGGRPFLVAYDVPTLGGNDDFDPIAADVEDFQVAYVMNPQPVGSNVAPVGTVPGTDWVMGNVSTDTLPDPTALAPRQEQAYDVVERYNAHPANIRAVRVSLVTRSRFADRQRKDSYPTDALEDYSRGAQPIDGYTRLLNTTTVRIPNMLSRTTFTPDFKTTAGVEGNFNGG